MSDTPSPRVRRPARLWVIPPGLMTHEEPFEGHRVLDEVRTPLGVTLWEFIRDVDLWATTPPESRARLFVSGLIKRRRERIAALGAAREIREPLETICRGLDGRLRDGGKLISRACHILSRWATDQGLPRTAVAFAQSAALATPELAAPAYIVGVLARRTAEWRLSDTWFRRAMALGRRGGEWEHYGNACLGLGSLHRDRGDLAAARTWYLKALRISRRKGLWDVRAKALHDLFLITAAAELPGEAEIWARRAFRAYGPRHPRLIPLAHDVARFWLSQRHYEESLRVFRAVLSHVHRVPERRLATSHMALAAAGAGDRLTFASMWSETWRLVDEYDDTERVAETLIALAEGAKALGDPDRGSLAANHALKVAVGRGEAAYRKTAEQLLESLRTMAAGVPAPRQRAESLPDGTVEFAVHLVECLGATSAVDEIEVLVD